MKIGDIIEITKNHIDENNEYFSLYEGELYEIIGSSERGYDIKNLESGKIISETRFLFMTIEYKPFITSN